MAGKRKQTDLIPGRAAHRRTEGDYMGVMLAAVTLEDWRSVINSAKTAAKAGDAKARAWLAQYLMGRPDGKAPTPMTVIVQQLNGADPLVDKLAAKAIWSAKYPEDDDRWKDEIKALVAAELEEKVSALETMDDPSTARMTSASRGCSAVELA